MAAAAISLATPLAASDFDFDPFAPCSETVNDASPQKVFYVAMWATGYAMASRQQSGDVDFIRMSDMWAELSKGCEANPSASMVDIVSGSAAQSSVDPRPMLMRFYEPNANFTALTLALQPTEAEIRAVYAEPLASILVESYAEMYSGLAASGGGLGPKPKHNDLLIVQTTTAELARDASIQREFPGGYSQVLSYFIGDYPIVRFKFVTSGESIGMASDGLIFINDHWVLMPKPWRSLD